MCCGSRRREEAGGGDQKAKDKRQRARGKNKVGSGQRQLDAEGGAFSGLAFYVNFAAVNLGDPAGDGEAEAGPAHLAAAGFIGTVKTLEDIGQVFARNADAGVAHFTEGGAVAGAESDGDVAAGRRVL